MAAMFLRSLLCVVLLGCGGGSKTKPTPAPEPATPPPATAAATPDAALATPPPAEPAGPKRLAPPQRWEELGKRGDELVLMGYVEWKGGDQFDVQVMGSMKMMLQQMITDAIAEKPDDAGGAIQGVMDKMNEMAGESKMIQWVRK